MMSRTQCFPDTTGKAHLWTPSNCDNRHKTFANANKAKPQPGGSELQGEGEGFYINGVTLDQSTIFRAGPTSKSSWATQIGLNRFKAKKERP